MRVFVTGATGVAGRYAVPALVAAGHDVSAVARTQVKADQVTASGARPVTVDLFDAEAVRATVGGHDAIVNLATAIPPFTKAVQRKAWRENDRIRREVSARLVDAALAADVPRLVQESIGFLYPDCGDRWIDEDVAAAPTALTEAAVDAEAAAARLTSAGGHGVVLRFAQFLAPESIHCGQMLNVVRRFRVSPVLGAPERFASSIHGADIGTAVVAALRVPAGTWNVGDDDPLTAREFVDAIAEAAGVGRVRWTGTITARVAGRRAEPVARSQRISNRRFRDATGWAPAYPDARAAWAQIVPALDHGAEART